MKKILYCIFIYAIILASCDNDKVSIPECNVEYPLEELSWLKDVKNSLTNCSCQISIIQGEYKGKSVFYTLMNDPVCNSVFHVIIRDCNGDVVKEYKQGENDDFNNEVKFVKSIYTCTE
jgi:hypothetical protein